MHNGDVVRDTITGFQGVVIAETVWLNGCRRLTVQPKELHDGKPVDSITFDIEQLELVKVEGVAPATKAPTGGPHPEPTRATF